MRSKFLLCLAALLFFSAPKQESNYPFNYIFPETESTIGGREEEVLGINDFDMDSEGKIFISERYNNQIVVYSPQGKRLYAFGRKGKGPGEFLSPIGISISDGKVYVFDARNKRIQIFTKAGEFIFSFKLDVRFCYSLAIIGDRLFFVTEEIRFSQKPEKPLAINHFLSDLKGHNIKKLFSYISHNVFKPHSFIVTCFPEAQSRVSKDKIFIVDSGREVRYRILIYSNSGKKLGEIKKPHKVRTVSPAMKKGIISYFEKFLPSSYTSMGRTLKPEYSFPTYVPAIRGIVVDGGKLLVQTWEDWWKAVKKQKDESQRRYEVDVYSIQGEYLGRGITNLDFQKTIFNQNYVYEVKRTPPNYEVVLNVYRRPE